MDLSQGTGGLDRALGVEVLEADGDRVVLVAPIGPQLLQPYGIVHGGVYCSMVESAASIGGALWFGERGNVVGVANSTNFLRAAREGRLTATAEPIHRGRTQQLWRVTITGDTTGDGGGGAARTLAIGEVRLANITDAAVLGGAAG